jgi:DNA-binding response OmpR family regulator
VTSPSPVVLLVEQDIVVRHPLAEYLRECGFVVFEAANGDEAMAALTSPDVQIEVVLAEMTTAGSGFALRQWIRARDLPVEVILAGSIETAVDRAGRLCNEGPALAKPYQHHLVLDHIRQAIARRGRGKT